METAGSGNPLLRLHTSLERDGPATTAGPAPQPKAKAKSTWPRLSKPLSQLGKYYPVLIIGSGYGGGVSACRLTGVGQTVCVLERGEEKWPGECKCRCRRAVDAPSFVQRVSRVGSAAPTATTCRLRGLHANTNTNKPVQQAPAPPLCTTAC